MIRLCTHWVFIYSLKGTCQDNYNFWQQRSPLEAAVCWLLKLILYWAHLCSIMPIAIPSLQSLYCILDLKRKKKDSDKLLCAIWDVPVNTIFIHQPNIQQISPRNSTATGSYLYYPWCKCYWLFTLLINLITSLHRFIQESPILSPIKCSTLLKP